MFRFPKPCLLRTALTLCGLSIFGIALLASGKASASDAGGPYELSVYPPVPSLDPSPHYRFRVRQVESGEWAEPFAWFTKCPESNPENDASAYYSEFIGGWSQTYCNFEMGEGVFVEVEITRLDPDTGEPIDIHTATPHPRRKVRSWRVEDGKAYVIIDQPTLFAVDIDGQMDENLAPRSQVPGWGASAFPFTNENAIHTVTVFAKPFIKDKPDPNDPSVYLVEPGEIPDEDGDWTSRNPHSLEMARGGMSYCDPPSS